MNFEPKVYCADPTANAIMNVAAQLHACVREFDGLRRALYTMSETVDDGASRLAGGLTSIAEAGFAMSPRKTDDPSEVDAIKEGAIGIATAIYSAAESSDLAAGASKAK